MRKLISLACLFLLIASTQLAANPIPDYEFGLYADSAGTWYMATDDRFVVSIMPVACRTPAASSSARRARSIRTPNSRPSIMVFDMDVPGNIVKAVRGERVGTLVAPDAPDAPATTPAKTTSCDTMAADTPLPALAWALVLLAMLGLLRRPVRGGERPRDRVRAPQPCSPQPTIGSPPRPT